MRSATVLISISEHANPATGYKPVRVAFERLADVVRHKVNYSATTFRKQYRNCTNAEQGQELIILDFDDGLTIAEAMVAFEEYFGLIATTRNHMKAKHGNVSERFRVILPTSKPITLDPEQFKMMMTEVMRRYPQADPACKNIDRMYFGAPGAEVHFLPGTSLFDWQPVYLQAVERWQQERSRIQRSCRAPSRHDLEALTRQVEKKEIDLTENYEDWVRIGFALNHELGPDGESYFHRLSQFHPGYEPSKCSKKYEQCASDGQVTLGTIFYLAKQAGINVKTRRPKRRKKRR